MKHNLVARGFMSILGLLLVFTTIYTAENAAHRALVDHGVMGWVVLTLIGVVSIFLVIDTSFCILGAKAACRVTQKYRYRLWMCLALTFSSYALVMIKNAPANAEVVVWSLYAVSSCFMALLDLLDYRLDDDCKIQL